MSVLNDKQARFVEEYLIDLNATKAAERAGYSEKTAYSQGQRLLKHAEIQALITQKRLELAAKCDVSSERVVREVAALAFSDVRKLLNDDGSMKQISELDDVTAAAVSSVEVSEIVAEDGTRFGIVKKIRLWDKNSAQERLCKHLGLFEQDNKRKVDPIAELLKQIGGSLPVKP